MSADAAPPSAAPPLSPVTVRDWSTTRVAFGLDASPAHLDAVARDPHTTTIDIGVPITVAEHAEMVRRDSLGRYIGAIDTAGHGSPLYGGVSLDQAAGGVIVLKVVRYVPTDSSQRDFVTRLLALVPASTPTVVRSVPYSRTTLLHAIDRVTQVYASGALGRYDVTSSSSSEDGVTLTIEQSAPAGTEAALHRMFPWPFLTVTRESAGSIRVSFGPASGRLPLTEQQLQRRALTLKVSQLTRDR